MLQDGEKAREADKDGRPGAELVEGVTAALEAGDRAKVRELTKGLDAADLADLIGLLEPARRAPLIEALVPDFDFDVLTRLDASIKDELIAALPRPLIAEAVRVLDSDDAVYLLEDMEKADQDAILAQVPTIDRAAVERGLEYPEDTAGRLMQADFVAVPPFRTVGWIIDYLRAAADLPENFSEIYVVDAKLHVLGSVPLDRFIRTKRDVAIDRIMDTDRHLVLATADQEEVARQFERYGLVSAAVVDADERLVGVVTVDDVVEVIQDEAEEDIKLLAGVGHESVTDRFEQIAPSRLWWLFVNLLTALLASLVIKSFDATIEQMVALAVLMPIVASMGGNAGTQTMTVAVRALATRELRAANLARFVLREGAVGLTNGLAFAVIMGLIAFIWFGSGALGLVIGAAMIVNLLAAAVAGIFIPVVLHRYRFDPAVASTVFVTTVTDVVGFFAFLGLATLWLK